jgi:hypothetical protein
VPRDTRASLPIPCLTPRAARRSKSLFGSFSSEKEQESSFSEEKEAKKTFVPGAGPQCEPGGNTYFAYGRHHPETWGLEAQSAQFSLF